MLSTSILSLVKRKDQGFLTNQPIAAGYGNIRYVVKNEYFSLHGRGDSRCLELAKGWEGIAEDKGSSHNGNLMYRFVLLFNKIVFGGIRRMQNVRTSDLSSGNYSTKMMTEQHELHLKDVQDAEGD